MMDETSYGSSEYSAEAEELFAQYLLARDVGEPIDFEAFAQEHEAWTEELYGLHTDWDNVRGLLGRLEQRRGPSESAEPAGAALGDAAPAGADPAPEALPPAAASSGAARESAEGGHSPADPEAARRPLLLALAILGLVAAAVGYLAIDFYRSGEVLAARGAQTREQLDEERGQRAQLEDRRAALAVDLEAERAARTLREQQLAEEQEALRLAREEALRVQSELDREELRAELLQLAVECEALLGEPELEAPDLRGQRELLEGWSQRARPLLESRESLVARRAELRDESTGQDIAGGVGALEQQLARLLVKLERLAALDERVARELELLEHVARATKGFGAGFRHLPRGIVALGIVQPSGGLWRFRDLFVQFADDELLLVPGEDALMLTSWGVHSLDAEQAAGARRLGYRRLTQLEARVLAEAAGLEVTDDSELPRWALDLP